MSRKDLDFLEREMLTIPADELKQLTQDLTPLVKRPFRQAFAETLDVFQKWERRHPEIETMFGSPPAIVHAYLWNKYADERSAAEKRASRPSVMQHTSSPPPRERLLKLRTALNAARSALHL